MPASAFRTKVYYQLILRAFRTDWPSDLPVVLQEKFWAQVEFEERGSGQYGKSQQNNVKFSFGISQKKKKYLVIIFWS